MIAKGTSSLKKNVWSSDCNQISPFGAFKTIFKEDKNPKNIEIFPETKTLLKENDIVERNREINEKMYDDQRFELIDKYKDFILEKEILSKTKALKITNDLLENGLKLLKNLQTQKDLKSFDNRSNYILISYEIRKVFLDLLRIFQNLSSNEVSKSNFLNIRKIENHENEINNCSEKSNEQLSKIEEYIHSVLKLANI